MIRPILLLLILGGCQEYNSNSSDRETYGPVLATGTAEFKAAYRIQRNRCANCHTHSEWGNYLTEQDWIDNNLVVPGSPESSPFITRIINTGGPGANMPVGEGPLPDEEYDVLTQWVENIQ